MLKNNNLIVIYGKAGSYKSSISSILVNGFDEIACYINLEDNKHLELGTKVTEYNDINMINEEFIDNAISDFDIVVIDSMEALEINRDKLIYLKELAKEHKTLLMVLTNNTNDDEFKDIADVTIHSKRNS